MADVAGKCISANESVSGRVVTKMPGTALFKIEPKINRQASTTTLSTKYDDKFDDKGYYCGN